MHMNLMIVVAEENESERQYAWQIKFHTSYLAVPRLREDIMYKDQIAKKLKHKNTTYVSPYDFLEYNTTLIHLT